MVSEWSIVDSDERGKFLVDNLKVNEKKDSKYTMVNGPGFRNPSTIVYEWFYDFSGTQAEITDALLADASPADKNKVGVIGIKL